MFSISIFRLILTSSSNAYGAHWRFTTRKHSSLWSQIMYVWKQSCETPSHFDTDSTKCRYKCTSHSQVLFKMLSPLTLSRLMSSSLLSLSCKSVAAALFLGDEPDSPRGISAGVTLSRASAPLTAKNLYKIPRWKLPFRYLVKRRFTKRENLDYLGL